MSVRTDVTLRNKMIYCIYVRNHTEEGTFNAIIPDLDRIKALGTDIVWFLPIHPIGVEKKKGSLGCPYAISNYREVNPAYGTMEDFKNLVEEIHRRDMQCIIDVVYNHTSPDSILATHNPEFFYKDENGNFGNRAGDWGDVIDLDYENEYLWKYQIETLKMWAEIVDGFRCDVAAKIPLDFWIAARREVNKQREDAIWLAESVHRGFVKYLRDMNMTALSDSQLYRIFDMTYDYDIWDEYQAYLKGEGSLSEYVRMVNLQESIYPENYVKMRCLENHDTPRIMSYLHSDSQVRNFTALEFFLKGCTLVYAGQEKLNEHTPSLFEYDKVDWNTGKDISSLIAKLAELKKDSIFVDGAFSLKAHEREQTITGFYRRGDETLVGVFALQNFTERVKVAVPDGNYVNAINGKDVIVNNGMINLSDAPVIFWVRKEDEEENGEAI